MFSIYLQNSCEGYQIFLDEKELSLEYSENKSEYLTSGNFSGVHIIKIVKKSVTVKPSEILGFWISTLLTSYDESFVALSRSAKSLEIDIEIESDENFELVFDTFTNQIMSCSGTCSIVNEKYEEDMSVKSKVELYIKLPFFILFTFTLVPIWILSILSLVKTFDVVAAILFFLISTIIVLGIIACFRDKKHGW